jgi:hypothetical protein
MEAKQTNPDNAILKAALEYLNNHKSIIPVGDNKVPLIKWKEFQSRLPTVEEVTRWFTQWPTAGIGFLTGKINDVTVADCDTPLLFEEINETIPEHTMTVTQKTPSQGGHFLFRYTEDVQQSQTENKNEIHIRNDGGFIRIAPTPGYTLSEKLETTDWLDPVPEEIKGLLNHNGTGKVTEGISTFQEEKARILQGVPEGSRDWDTFRYASSCIARGMNKEETLTLCLSLNRKHIPPLSEKEIEVKVYSAWETHQRNHLGAGQNLITKVDPRKRGDGKSLYEILAQPKEEEKYIVKPLLSRGDKGFVVSSYKMGKTLFLMQLALCLATGTAFLGMDVKPAKVLYVRFELKDSRFNDRLSLMTAGLGGQDRIQVQPYFEMARGFNIQSDSDYRWLMGLVEKYQAEVLILDPFYKMIPFDLKDTANAKPVIDRLDSITGTYPDLLTVIAHHLRKAGADEKNNWDQSYGPMFYFADADFQIRIKAKHREKTEFTLDVISNDAPVEPFMFKRDETTLLYSVPDMMGDYEGTVLEYIEQNTPGKIATLDWMMQEIGFTQRQAKSLIDRLITQDKILETKAGRGGKKFLQIAGSELQSELQSITPISDLKS